MAEFYTVIDETVRAFIEDQHIFFTASACAEGHINLSPKGMDTFRILDERTVAYLDLTGSGNETAAHIEHDGRLTIMMCGFAAKPLILRLYGRGEVIRPRDSRWSEYHGHFEAVVGERQVVVLHIESLQTSCGYAVPWMDYREERNTLVKWSDKKGPDGIAAYWTEKNQRSIDGLPTKLLED